MKTTRIITAILMGIFLTANASMAEDARSGGGGGGIKSLTWAVKFTTADSGTVAWKTSFPSASGTLTATGKIMFLESSYIDLTFTAKPGFKLAGVYKNVDSVGLDAQNHARFGPVDGNHLITAIFSEIVPTGTFPLSFPDSPATLTTVYDVSGNYKGSVPLQKVPRPYNVDIAQDEFGKVDAAGTVSGVAAGGNASGKTFVPVGSVKTVDNKPVGDFKGKFEGTVDGLPAQGTGGGTTPIELKTLKSRALGLGATVTYKGDVGGVPYSGKDIPMQFPLDATQVKNGKKAWTIQMNIVSTAVKGKPVITISGLLTLPSGDKISYPAVKTKYSAAKGYSVSFKGGTNISHTPNEPNKSAALAVKGMTMVQSGSKWTVTGGTVQYKFLGQKGQGNLSEFKLN